MTHLEIFKKALDDIGIEYEVIELDSYYYIYFGDEFFEFNPNGGIASYP
jgi:glutathione S-transferase